MSEIIFINFKSNFSILFSIIKYRKTIGIKNIVGAQTKIDKNEKTAKKKFFNKYWDGINKYINRRINTKISFLARTSISAIGYNMKIGVNIAKVIILLVFKFLNKCHRSRK